MSENLSTDEKVFLRRAVEGARRTQARLNGEAEAARPVPLTLEQQVDLFEQGVDAACDRVIHQLQNPSLRRVVQRMAKRRLIKGESEFGDAGWRWHPDQLMIESLEEMADAVVYLVMRDYGRSAGPGGRHPLTRHERGLRDKDDLCA